MNPLYIETIEKISAWAASRSDVHAAVVLGSQVRSELAGDEWSDLDVLLLVDAPTVYLHDAAWPDFLGQVACEILDETPLDWLHLIWSARRILFADNRAVDFSIMPFERIDDVLGLNAEIHIHGYRVIYEDSAGAIASKIERTLLTVKNELPKKPTQNELKQLENNLLYQLMWAGKKIKRGELWVAVSGINQIVSSQLLLLIEFYSTCVCQTNVRIRYEGRFLEKRIPLWLKEELPYCFAKYDAQDAAHTIGRLIDLTNRLATEICAVNGYPRDPRPYTAVRALLGEMFGS